ncbi:polyprenyl diphosphate synthase [Porticoccaceae bacterium LTM1]|nr:polyprenyl diphosphate synthase [Porticoccaceae bacterium LTM1]
MTDPVVSGAGDCPLRHVAIIMDGNNRWAKQRGLAGLAGHQAGVERVRDVLESCKRHQIDVLTLFAFSSENWRRPAVEVQGLMSLFASYLKKEIKPLKDKGVRLKVIGSRERFSSRLCKLIEEAEEQTKDGNQTLVLAVDYGGQWDITQAAVKLAQKVEKGELSSDQINEQLLAEQMSLADLPPVDLCIRTASQQRISNFLLWHLAYAELFFSDVFWPDFDDSAFNEAVEAFCGRQRRFGMTSAQIEENASA